MLEPILKGLVEWLYGMMIDIMAYASGELIGVMSMDLSYFERTAPVITDIVNIFIALGWAMLIGNLVFQVIKSMMSGIDFEAEDPKITFLRTFVFSFLLLASRQICDLCSGITGTVINLLELPSSINIVTPDESMFSLGSGAKWLLVIIVGVVLMVQMVKLLFEIGERYVITSVLTFFAPLAFSMGGSKNTNDIFKGWCRMYASMLVMMIMNIVFLKLIMSAMSQMAAGGVLIWLVFVVALTRVARKIDSHIGKLGLNPAQTGNEIGSHIPGIITAVAIRTMGSLVSRSMANAKGGNGGKSGRGGRAGRGGSANRPYGNRQGHRGGAGMPNPTGGNGMHTQAGNSVGQPTGGTIRTSGEKSGRQGGTNPTNGGTQHSHTTQNTPKSGNPHKPANVQNGTNGREPIQRQQAGPRPSTTHNEREVQRSGTNTHQGGIVQSGEIIENQITQRPPIPRDTARRGTGGNSTYHSHIQNDSSNSSDNKSTHTEVRQNGGTHKSTNQTGGTNAGNRSDIHTNKGGSRQYVSDVSGDSKGGNVSAGINMSSKNHDTMFSGDRNSTDYGGSPHNQTEHSRTEVHTDKKTEHGHNTDRTVRTTERQRDADMRIDHEYKNGRYNPAASNKKAKKTYYQRENPKDIGRDWDKPRNRGDKNGTKRKK